MKKILSVITCIAAVLSLTACKNGENDPASNSSNAAQSTVQSVASEDSSTAVSEPASSVPESQYQSSTDTESQPEETSKPKASYSFQREDGGVEILGGKDESTEVVVPSKVNEMNVVGISGSPNKTMFPNAQKITLPDTLKDIDSYAFSGCSALKSINIPASVEDIGEYAFQNCSSLTSVTFSEGLKDIDTGAFVGCSSLTEINLPNSMQELEPNAFDTNVAFTVTYMGKSYTPSNISELYSLLADN